MNNQEQRLRELEKKLIELEKDKTIFHKFNIFETLKVTQTEIRHSNVLAWLLDPLENHNMDDSLIRKLTQRLKLETETYLEPDSIDFSQFRLKREWNNIDILAVNQKDQIIIVIENKIWSSESTHQLEKYKETIEKNYKDYSKYYVYLTPFGDPSSNPDLWITLDYQWVLDTLQALINERFDRLNQEVLIFLNHYLVNLRRNIVGDKELTDLCIEIYNTHKEAFDLIMNHLPDQRTQYYSAIMDYLQSRSDVILDDSGKTLIRFTTNKLDPITPKSHAGWTKSGRVMLFEIENFDTMIRLKTVVGPSLEEERNDVLQYMDACQNKSLFKDINLEKHIMNSKTQKSRRFSHVNGEDIFDKSNYDIRTQNDFAELLSEMMDNLFDNYIKHVEDYFALWNK